MPTNKPFLQARPVSQASLPETDAMTKQPLALHKTHLLRFLKVLKDHKHARFFLDPAHLDALRLPRYPEIIKPILNLGTIERKLRENRYPTTENFTDDFKCIFEEARRQWRGSHRITRASKKLLLTVEAVVGHLPMTGLSSHQVERLDIEIRKIEMMHQKDFFRPRDNLRPMHELSRVHRDVVRRRHYQSLREVRNKVASLFRMSAERNGPRHEITLHMRNSLEVVDILLKETTPEAGSLELEEPSDEQLLNNAESSAAVSEKPQAMSKREFYVKQRMDECLAGKPTQHKRLRNLVVERILERTGEVVEIETENSDADEEKAEGLEAEDGNERDFHRAQLHMKGIPKDYTDNLRNLPKDPPTLEQINALNNARLLGPNFLGRTASLTPGVKFGKSRKTNGSTSRDFLLPAADTNEDYDQHATLEHLTQGEIIYMTGHHLAWADLRGDELLSYSTDMLFLVVHALGRANRGQGGVTIQLLDRRRARTTDGVRAKFYHALDLYTIFEVPRWPGWKWKNKLHPRKFTHEYLSHGTLRCHDSTLKQAALEDLIRDGLYEIFPPLQTPKNHKRVPLYRLQVIYRRIGYPPRFPRIGEVNPPIYSYEDCAQVRAMTVELLQTVRKVSLNFRHSEDESNTVETEPPLHAFIGFLTFEKRQRADPVFTQWIKQHYTPQDILDLYTYGNTKVNPGLTIVADNLPGVMQYLDLVRDCIEIFDLPRLPPNDVRHAHAFDGTMDRPSKYAACDDQWNSEYRETSNACGSASDAEEDADENDGFKECADDEEDP